MNDEEFLSLMIVHFPKVLISSFKEEHSALCLAFGNDWVAFADLWESDLLSLLRAIPREKGDKTLHSDYLRASLNGDSLKRCLKPTETHFNYVGNLILLDFVVKKLLSEMEN